MWKSATSTVGILRTNDSISQENTQTDCPSVSHMLQLPVYILAKLRSQYFKNSLMGAENTGCSSSSPSTHMAPGALLWTPWAWHKHGTQSGRQANTYTHKIKSINLGGKEESQPDCKALMVDARAPLAPAGSRGVCLPPEQCCLWPPSPKALPVPNSTSPLAWVEVWLYAANPPPLLHRKEPQCNIHIFMFISTVITWNMFSYIERKTSRWFTMNFNFSKSSVELTSTDLMLKRMSDSHLVAEPCHSLACNVLMIGWIVWHQCEVNNDSQRRTWLSWPNIWKDILWL